MGGEACSWSEHADEGNLDDRLGIKLAASAHRFWSGDGGGGLVEAKRRLAKFRCHLRRRGWRMGPVIPDYCPVGPPDLMPHQLVAAAGGAVGGAAAMAKAPTATALGASEMKQCGEDRDYVCTACESATKEELLLQVS